MYVNIRIAKEQNKYSDCKQISEIVYGNGQFFFLNIYNIYIYFKKKFCGGTFLQYFAFDDKENA